MIEDSLLGLGIAGFHRLSYTDWGDPAAERVVLCAHGLTRNGRDFDRLAERLAESGARVVCPDIVGRGRSDWLPSPALYTDPQSLADLTALIARIGAAQIDWVGTSMGGLLGMVMAAQPKTPIRRLVINDVGPFVPGASLERIGGYVGADPIFEDVAAVEAYLRFLYTGFGTLPDPCWRAMAEHGHRVRADGRLGLAYDPAIGVALKAGPLADIDLWPLWDRIACPVLALRGESSDLLLADTAREMAERGPKATVVEIPGTAHAPSLMVDDQIELIRDFLFS